MTRDPNSIARLAASILQSDRAGHEVVELMCEVVIAQSRVSVWSAGVAKASSRSDEAAWLRFLEDFDQIEAEVVAAGHQFLTARWPDGAFAVWQRETTTFLSALGRAFAQLTELGTAHGRKNQTELRSNAL